MEVICLTGDSKFYVNHSLCLYYRILWLKSKVFLNMRKINRLMVSNGTLNSELVKIVHYYQSLIQTMLGNISMMIRVFLMSSGIGLQNSQVFL